MALEHALLVALREQPASGLELAQRFERSIGYFWSATHQQIYRVLGRMDGDGWVHAEVVAQRGRPDKKVYTVTDLGETALSAWLAEPSAVEPMRSDLALKMRAATLASDGAAREAVLGTVRSHLADHHARLDHYRQLAKRDYPEPSALTGLALDQYLVLRGGIGVEEFWTRWLTEYLEAHA